METVVVLISLWVVSVIGIKEVNNPVDNICVDKTVEQVEN